MAVHAFGPEHLAELCFEPKSKGAGEDRVMPLRLDVLLKGLRTRAWPIIVVLWPTLCSSQASCSGGHGLEARATRAAVENEEKEKEGTKQTEKKREGEQCGPSTPTNRHLCPRPGSPARTLHPRPRSPPAASASGGT